MQARTGPRAGLREMICDYPGCNEAVERVAFCIQDGRFIPEYLCGACYANNQRHYVAWRDIDDEEPFFVLIDAPIDNMMIDAITIKDGGEW